MGASALDMTLDDVIKTKGNNGNKRGGNRQETKKAPAASSRPVASAGAGATAGIAKRAVKSAVAAIAPAAKAAAAAAKATATASTPAGRRGVNSPGLGGVAAKERVGSAPKREFAAKKVAAASGGGGVTGTAAKLGMSLEDMIKKGAVSKRSEKRTGKAGGVGEKAKAGAGAKAGKGVVGGARRLKKLRSEGGNFNKKATPKAKANARQSNLANARKAARGGKFASKLAAAWFGGGKGKGKGKGMGKGARRGGAAWNDAWEMESWGGKGGGFGMTRKRLMADSWGPGEKRMRMDGPPARNSFGWGKGGDRGGARDSWGGGRVEQRWSAGGGDDRRASGFGRGVGDRGAAGWGNGRAAWGDRDRDDRGDTRTSNSGCRIKVSNAPSNLEARDIREAFEDNGRVVRCEVDRGVAFVTFERAADAKRAMQTFDRGELNGRTIYVSAA